MSKKETYYGKIERDAYLSVFQKKVLKAVLDIPRGEVRSYGFIAARINSPRAARAVGRVLAMNPYAPHVPCHRVIASDGSIGGYSGKGGIKKKRCMLKKEGAVVSGYGF